MGEVLFISFKMSKSIFDSIFLIFTLFLISGSVGDICDDTIKNFLTVVENDTSIDMQIDVLLPVCSQIEEEEARRHCERNINSYWSFFVSPDFGFYREIYMRVSNINQICDIQFGNEDECTKCNIRLSEMGKIMVREDTKADLTSMVQGDYFCNMDGAWWDIEVCQAEWEWLMPELMDTLAAWFTSDTWSNTFCSENMQC